MAAAAQGTGDGGCPPRGSTGRSGSPRVLAGGAAVPVPCVELPVVGCLLNMPLLLNSAIVHLIFLFFQIKGT